MNVSVILVNYNTCNLTRNCLASIYEKTEGVEFEVFVVDNASSDDSCKMIEEEFPQVKLIKNSENKGFGAANNIAIRQSNAKYVFLLNTDTILLNNAVKIFFDFMENPENQNIGACGGVLYDKDISLIKSYSNFPRLKDFLSIALFINKLIPSIIPNCEYTKSIVGRVDAVTGADLMLRKSVLEEVGLFNERFFMYYEETELQHRMKKSRYFAAIVPDAKIVHLVRKSSDNFSANFISVKSSLIYFEICGNKIDKNILRLIYIIWYLLRMVFCRERYEYYKSCIKTVLSYER